MRFLEKHYLWFLVLCLLVFVASWPLDVMEEDAAQYASISSEMLQKSSYLKVFHRNEPYLDKPPLAFWLAASSFSIFGVHTWAYKFPNFLFAILGILSVFHLGKLQYNERVGKWSALFLASCQALFLMNNDCRTDLYLMSAVVFATWQWKAYLQKGQKKYVLGIIVGLSLALLAKGPVGLMVPFFALMLDAFALGYWKKIVQPRIFWDKLFSLLVIVLGLIIFLMPMCWGLYQQYGIEGLRFYFWTQSFGRITGENTWDNNPDPFFLWHSTLWAFLPWSLMFFYALSKAIFRIFKKQGAFYKQDALALGGFIFPMLALTLSKYQLPHYAFVTYPFAALITASWWVQGTEGDMSAKEGHIWRILYSVLWIVLVVLGAWLAFYCLETPLFVTIFLFLSFAVFTIFTMLKRYQYGWMLHAFGLIVFINALLNLSIYPALMPYQVGGQIGKWIHEHKIPTDRVKVFHFYEEQALDFYSGSFIRSTDNPQSAFPDGDCYLIVAQKGLDELRGKAVIDTLYQGEDYHITTLTGNFLNPATRKSTTEHVWFLKVLRWL